MLRINAVSLVYAGTSDASLIPAGQKRLSTQVAPRNGQKPDKSSSGSSDHIR